MPERRIDAIGNADATAWQATHLSKGSPHAVRILSGQLSHMMTGELMSAVVQKAAKGAFKITLNGETLIIKGLPASLLGKAVSFVFRQTLASGKTGIELFWLGQDRAKNAAMQTSARLSTLPSTRPSAQPSTRPSAKLSAQTSAQPSAQLSAPPSTTTDHARVHLLSGMSASLLARMKGGKTVPGQIEHIQTGKMTLTIALPEPNNPAKSIHHQIQTTAIQHLKPGQTILVRMPSGISDTVLEILPQQQVNQPIVNTAGKAPATLKMASFTLAAGSITSAIVQKRLPNGFIQLHIQGVTVTAPAPETIVEGDLLTLRMTTPPAGFQLLSVQKNAAEKAVSVLKNNLPVNHEPLAQTLMALRNIIPAILDSGMANMREIASMDAWLNTHIPDQQQPVNGMHLARLMRDSGTGLEAKLLSLMQQAGQQAPILQDLKTVLLQLSGIQGGSINHANVIKTLSELSQHASARIETTQALNVLAHMQGEPIRFELPMLVGQQLVNVQMSIQQQQQSSEQQGHDSSNQGSNQPFSVLLALELSGIGKMRVDAAVSEQSVHARIYSDQTGVGQFIRGHIQRLETRLQNLGYKEVFLLAAQTPPDAEKQRRFDQLTTMAPASLNLLDVIA